MIKVIRQFFVGTFVDFNVERDEQNNIYYKR